MKKLYHQSVWPLYSKIGSHCYWQIMLHFWRISVRHNLTKLICQSEFNPLWAHRLSPLKNGSVNLLENIVFLLHFLHFSVDLFIILACVTQSILPIPQSYHCQCLLKKRLFSKLNHKFAINSSWLNTLCSNLQMANVKADLE